MKNGIFTTNAMNRIVWNTKAEPNAHMANALLQLEKKYYSKFKKKKVESNVLTTKIVENTPAVTVNIEPQVKEYTVKIRGNEVILGVDAFMSLINK